MAEGDDEGEAHGGLEPGPGRAAEQEEEGAAREKRGSADEDGGDEDADHGRIRVVTRLSPASVDALGYAGRPLGRGRLRERRSRTGREAR